MGCCWCCCCCRPGQRRHRVGDRPGHANRRRRQCWDCDSVLRSIRNGRLCVRQACEQEELRRRFNRALQFSLQLYMSQYFKYSRCQLQLQPRFSHGNYCCVSLQPPTLPCQKAYCVRIYSAMPKLGFFPSVIHELVYNTGSTPAVSGLPLPTPCCFWPTPCLPPTVLVL